MHEITIATIGFYAAVFTIAFAACVARTVREPDGLNWRNTTSLGCTAGFLSFGAACILVDSATSDGFSPWYWLGGSALLGLLAKEQDKMAKILISKVVLAGRKFFEKDKGEE